MTPFAKINHLCTFTRPKRETSTKTMDDFILFIILGIAGSFFNMLYNQLRKAINVESPAPKKEESKATNKKKRTLYQNLKTFSLIDTFQRFCSASALNSQ